MGLKKNSKGELVEASAFRSRKNSIYRKESNEPFKISRSKFSNFLSCRRCFYLDRVKGLKDPSMPGWALNLAVDELLKKEFDFYRKSQKPHPIMIKNKLNFVPFLHKDMYLWRDAKTAGISYLDERTNLIIHGGVDDVWFDLDQKKLIVVDYKAQSSAQTVNTYSYLNNIYHHDYKLQMDIYVHILRKMGFEVSDLTYFYVCNGEKSCDKFDSKINFLTTLVPYTSKTSWIDKKVSEMKSLLESDQIPEINKSCEQCAYLTGGKKF